MIRARRVLAAAFLLAASAAVAQGQDPPSPAQPPGDPAMKPPEHKANRLAKESSPYLLQHAHNPVDWYPWGDEAFARAKKEDKPVFLSIGYSTCHWCHVMERESFEDEAIAKLVNDKFVAIKVDREERPDVDAVYMAAVQAMSGQGGWPLTVFLTPEGRPFFGGTYFPPNDRGGRPGFPSLLKRISELWETRRNDVVQSAEQLAQALRENAAGTEKGAITEEWFDHAVAQFRSVNDAARGGFGPAPKFPRAFALSFLLARAPKADTEMRAMVLGTLDHMRRGGIHDHVGGGFHRYSTDVDWLVPHFEKMLYDQALVARAYLDAYQVTHDPAHATVVRDVLDYVLRDLRDPAGGFHSAEDADSEGVEGKFYVWTTAEVRQVLGSEDAALFERVYALDDAGNFVDEAARTRTGANIPYLRAPIEHHAKVLGTDAAALETRLGALRAKLFAVRAKRIRPHLDDKVLADWNGLMIGTMARAGAVLGDDRYVREAARAADFVLASMRKDGRLLHRWRKGDAAVPAFAEDHAFLALGLMDLYEATFDARWIAEAHALAKTLAAEFQDADGTFRLASSRGEKLFHAPKELYDGALPSANSASALALVRVARATGDEALDAASRRCVEAWAATIEAYPMGYVFALEAAAWHLRPTREIVIAGDPADAATRALVAETRARFLPDAVVLVHPPGAAGKAIEGAAPFLANQGLVGGKPAAYVCTGRTCQAPVTTPAELARLLEGETKR